MLAGDVFNFAGLDTNDYGNVYVQINLANNGGIKVFKESWGSDDRKLLFYHCNK